MDTYIYIYLYIYMYTYIYTYILDTSIHHLFYHQFLHVIEDLQVAKSPGVNLFQQGFTSDTGPKRSWFLHHEKRGVHGFQQVMWVFQELVGFMENPQK